ncbi:hypothetical protein D3C78_1560350 [compost metagenome]
MSYPGSLGTILPLAAICPSWYSTIAVWAKPSWHSASAVLSLSTRIWRRLKWISSGLPFLVIPVYFDR